jgi:hypothetical protein
MGRKLLRAKGPTQQGNNPAQRRWCERWHETPQIQIMQTCRQEEKSVPSAYKRTENNTGQQIKNERTEKKRTNSSKV